MAAKSITLKFIPRGTFDEECQLWFDRSSVWFNGKLSKCLFKKARNNAEEPTVRWSNKILGHAVVTVRPDGVPSTAAVTKSAACRRRYGNELLPPSLPRRYCVHEPRKNDEQRAPSNIIHLESSQSHCNPKVECVQIAQTDKSITKKKKNASEIIT